MKPRPLPRWYLPHVIAWALLLAAGFAMTLFRSEAAENAAPAASAPAAKGAAGSASPASAGSKASTSAAPASAAPAAAPPAVATPPAPKAAAPPAPAPANKPAEAKPAERKREESKPAEAKAAAKPAEAKPAEAKAAEAKPVPAVKPGAAISYTQLARPLIADRLRLSEEQRARVAALLADRNKALAKATEAERTKALEENEKDLAAILTDAQRAELAKIPPEPKLRFKFRFQRWVDVLDEVAKQAGLSLVLDAPPPGTLNYSDDKEYTPTEAIDLLNQILLTKGYTLIRRDRMLVCINIEEGVPENLVQRVTMDELDYRGRFEMVSVLFPLEGRPAATITAEIKPLMSTYGKVTPLPATGQLLVTDAAGNIRAIRTVIKTIPTSAPQVAKPSPAEAPTFSIYPIRGIDPQSVLSVMKTLYPSASFILDPKTDQLNVSAGPSIHKSVKAILEEMTKTGEPPDKQSRLELYAVDPVRGSEILKSLEGIASHAKLTLDSKTGKIVAWATGAEHTLLKGALEKLGQAPLAEHARQFEVYRLTKADPKTTVTLLESLLPSARLAADAPTNSIVAIATAADQKAIQALLERLQPEKPGPDTPELRFYQLTQAPTPKLVTALEGLAPKAQIALDATSQRLMVVAPPADQETLKKAVEQLEAKLPPDKLPRFETYLLHGAEPTALVANLQTLAPNAKITTDTKAGRLVILATPAEHEIVRGAMDKLGRGTTLENTPQVETYRLTRVDPSTLVPLLQSLVPEAKVSVDSQTKTLIAVAVPADQQTIRALVEQLQPQKSARDAPELRTYPIVSADPTSVLTMLKGLYPTAQLVLDSKENRLMAWASPAEHTSIKASLEQIQAPAPPDQQPRFEVYPVHGADPTTLVTNLQTLVPNAKFVADAKASRIVAWGTAADQQSIKAALQRLVRGTYTSDDAPRLEVYHLTKADPTTVTTLLQTLVPDAKISVDPQTKTLIAVAVNADHLTIKTVLEQLQPEKPGPDAPQLRFYPLAQPAPTTLVTLLQGLAPKANVTLEPGGKRLSVVAVPADHAIVKAAIEQIQTVSILDEKNKLVTYPVTPEQKKRFQSIATALSSELPGMQVIAESGPDELAVWAKPSQHAVISEILEQLKREIPAAEKYHLAAYPIRAADPQNVLTVMKTLFPNTQFVLDTRTRRLIVWTLPADQEAIKAALEKIDAGVSAETQDKLMVYPVQDVDPSTLVTLLKEQFPDVKFSADTKAEKILAWARPADHAAIARTLKQMLAEPDAELKPTLIAYPLPGGDATSLVTVLKTLVPKAQLTAETKTNSIVATAVAKDHGLIRAAIEQLGKKGPAGTLPEMLVLSVPNLGPSGAGALTPALQKIFPDATFATGADATKLVVWARPADHEPIRKAVDEMSKKEPPETAHRLASCPTGTTRSDVAKGVLTILSGMFPDASFGLAGDGRGIFFYARPADHPRIKNMIEELTKPEPPETAHHLVVFTLDAHGPSGAAGLLPVLRTMFPGVLFSAGAEPDQLVGWVQPEDEKKIRAALKTLAAPESPDKARKMVAYTLETAGSAGVTGAISILTTMFPEAKFSPGTEPNKIVAWARPDDHKKIEAAVAELSKKEPPETARKIVVYPFKSTDSSASYYTLAALRTMFPEATFSLGADPGKLVVFARPADHDAIKSAIEQLSAEEPPEKARQMVVYALETTGSAGVTGAITILTSMFPDAKFSAGTDADKIVAWARPADQEKIKKAVAEISKKEPPETARRIVVYPFKSARPRAAFYTMSVLRSMFPDAEFSIGADPEKLVVWARPKEHEAIKSTVEQLSQEDPPERAHQLVAYTLEATGATGTKGAITLLSEMFPEARFNAGSDPGKVMAWARPAEHKKIAAAIEELSKREPPEKAPQAAVYQLDAIPAKEAVMFLTAAFPEAKFSAGSEPNKLIVWARPLDQKQIGEMVKKIEEEGAPELSRTVAVYPLKAGDAKSLSELLDPLVRRNVQLVADPTRHRLIVWADAKHQEAVKKTVEQFQKENAKVGEPSTQVYRFQWADAQAAQTVLTALVPAAHIALDTASHSLVVTATPEDHAKIKEAVDEMDRRDVKGQAPRLQVHRVTTVDPAHLLTVLHGLFRLRSDVQLTLDEKNDAIVAVASPAQHETIRNLIEQLEQEAKADSAVRLQLYPLKEADPDATLRVLTELLEKQGVKARLSLDPRSNQLVAIARPEQHAAIQKTLDQMQGEERILEIIPLETVEPWTAQMAIERMFSDNSFLPRADAPVVDADPTTQQLFVRGTKEQMTKIREVLVKLGETGAWASGGGEGRRSRTIPFEGDLPAALDEIQRVWPQLHGNPIHVVKPPSEISVKGRSSKPSQKSGDAKIQPAAGPKDARGGQLPRNEVVPPPPPDAGGWRAGSTDGGWRASRATAEKPGPSGKLETGGWRAGSRQDRQAEASKPILVVPGEGTVTITSDDPAALARFEELLRALSRQKGTVGRNFSVFLLSNGKAAEVAQTLQHVFRSMPTGWRGTTSSAVLVPDERLNAIVAYGNRADRQTIENLVKVLDTAEVPESMTADRLHLIPVKNTSAARIEQIMRTMFRSQVDAFGVEETTNSLVVMASDPLAEEIGRVVKSLDEAAGSDPSRTVTIIPLRKTSAERVEKALDIILKSRSPR